MAENQLKRQKSVTPQNPLSVIGAAELCGSAFICEEEGFGNEFFFEPKFDFGNREFVLLNKHHLFAKKSEKNRRDTKVEAALVVLRGEIEGIIAHFLELREEGQDIGELKNPFCGNLIAAITESVRDAVAEFFQDFEGDQQSWESRFRGDILKKCIIALSSGKCDAIYGFAESFCEAALYSCLDEEGEFLEEGLRHKAFEKIKIAADLQDCVGGAVSALDKITQSIRDMGSLSGEVEEKLTLLLEPYCERGNQAHIGAYLNFIFGNKNPADEHYLVPSSDMMMGDIKGLLQAVIFGGGNLVISCALDKIKALFEEARALRGEGEDATYDICDYEFLGILEELRRKSGYEFVENIEIQDLLAIDESGEFSKMAAIIRPYLQEGEELSTDEFLQNKEILSLIIDFNVFLIRNKPIPVWLRNRAIKFFELDFGGQDCDFERIESEIVTCLDKESQKLASMFKLPIKLARNLAQEVDFCRDDKLRAFGGKASLYSELLQNAIASGEGCGMLEAVLKIIDKGKPDFYKSRKSPISLDGVIFNPEREKIIELIASPRDVEIDACIETLNITNVDYCALMRRAIILGDELAIKSVMKNLDAELFRMMVDANLRMESGFYMPKFHWKSALLFCKILCEENELETAARFLSKPVDRSLEEGGSIELSLFIDILAENKDLAGDIFAYLTKIMGVTAMVELLSSQKCHGVLLPACVTINKDARNSYLEFLQNCEAGHLDRLKEINYEVFSAFVISDLVSDEEIDSLLQEVVFCESSAGFFRRNMALFCDQEEGMVLYKYLAHFAREGIGGSVNKRQAFSMCESGIRKFGEVIEGHNLFVRSLNGALRREELTQDQFQKQMKAEEKMVAFAIKEKEALEMLQEEVKKEIEADRQEQEQLEFVDAVEEPQAGQEQQVGRNTVV